MSCSSSNQRYRRGDPSPVVEGLLFWRYEGEKEKWRTKEGFEKGMKSHQESCSRQRKTPEFKAKANTYFKSYSKTESHKKWRSEYRCRPEISAAAKLKYATDPKIIPHRLASTEKRAARRAHLASDEYKQFRAKEALARYHRSDKAAVAKRIRERRKTNPDYRIKDNTRRRINKMLHRDRASKNCPSWELVGCSISDFRRHLESHFKEGMSWLNMGEWELDHVLPLAMFTMTDEKQLRLAFNWQNTRPEWAAVNRRKSDSIPGELFRGRHYKLIPFQSAA